MYLEQQNIPLLTQTSLVPRLSVGVARLRGCWKESLVSTARACASFSIKSTCVFIDDGVELTSCINLRNATRRVCRSYSSKNSISLAGKRREHQQWSTRLSEQLLVSVALDDGLPQHVALGEWRQ